MLIASSPQAQAAPANDPPPDWAYWTLQPLIVQQIEEFRTGRRQCAGPDESTCRDSMATIARLLSDADIREVATYFSQLNYRSRARVVEAARVPTFEVFRFELAARKNAGTEPIGQRIIELVDHPLQVYLSDPRTPITAYVPPGSIARGKKLVEGGKGGGALHDV